MSTLSTAIVIVNVLFLVFLLFLNCFSLILFYIFLLTIAFFFRLTAAGQSLMSRQEELNVKQVS